MSTHPSRSTQMRQLLRLTTAGSVDDGKSTLIGRLLLDSKAILSDHWESVEAHSRRRNDPQVDLALLTDGLKAEREQKITIDVAYRFFSTARRKFIIADCPGHLEYTRNMVTGASTADLAIVLVDATKGLLTQSKRHAFLATLLGVPHLLVAINKMDLVDFKKSVYEDLCREFRAFASKLDTKSLTTLPISALLGDNVTRTSESMPWYQGGTLLHLLENVNLGSSDNVTDFRFPVQGVVRPDQSFRGYSGRIASGRIQLGDEVVCLPSGTSSTVGRIIRAGKDEELAFVGDSVMFELNDEIDISRGDLLVRKNNLPQRASDLDVTLCWMSTTPLNPNLEYIFRLGTRETPASIKKIDYLIDVDSMHRAEARPLELNEIGRVQISLAEPFFFDSYRQNRVMGSAILIDPTTQVTVAAGMIRGPFRSLKDMFAQAAAPRATKDLHPSKSLVTREQREARQGHSGAVVWLTGLSGSGKSTIARELEKLLFERGCQVLVLDGDNVRSGLCSDLGFSAEDRRENIRRVSEVAALMAGQGTIVICAFISPYREGRAKARKAAGEARFFEVFVDCPLEECERRDPKGLYARARRGEIADFTGVSAPYEEPEGADLVLDSRDMSPDEAAEGVVQVLNL